MFHPIHALLTQLYVSAVTHPPISSPYVIPTLLSSFQLGTYHMPCAFYLPPVMMIHCALSVQHTQRLAKSFGSTNAAVRGGNNNSPTEPNNQKSDSDNTKEPTTPSGPDPYILVGDFNIKPGSNMYRMITEGKDDPKFPSTFSQYHA